MFSAFFNKFLKGCIAAVDRYDLDISRIILQYPKVDIFSAGYDPSDGNHRRLGLEL
jgi:hypothetical protein